MVKQKLKIVFSTKIIQWAFKKNKPVPYIIKQFGQVKIQEFSFFKNNFVKMSFRNVPILWLF